jgi:hypothetical protein
MELSLGLKRPEVEVVPAALGRTRVHMWRVTVVWESAALLAAVKLGSAVVVEAVSESPPERRVPVVLELVVRVVSRVLEKVAWQTQAEVAVVERF